MEVWLNLDRVGQLPTLEAIKGNLVGQGSNGHCKQISYQKIKQTKTVKRLKSIERLKAAKEKLTYSDHLLTKSERFGILLLCPIPKSKEKLTDSRPHEKQDPENVCSNGISVMICVKVYTFADNAWRLILASALGEARSHGLRSGRPPEELRSRQLASRVHPIPLVGRVSVKRLFFGALLWLDTLLEQTNNCAAGP